MSTILKMYCLMILIAIIPACENIEAEANHEAILGVEIEGPASLAKEQIGQWTAKPFINDETHVTYTWYKSLDGVHYGNPVSHSKVYQTAATGIWLKVIAVNGGKAYSAVHRIDFEYSPSILSE